MVMNNFEIIAHPSEICNLSCCVCEKHGRAAEVVDLELHRKRAEVLALPACMDCHTEFPVAVRQIMQVFDCWGV